ncbi:MAG: glycosyltransferase, partial [Gammaproteobacteria bacterium]
KSSTKQKISSIVTITDFLSGVFLVEKRKSIIIRKSVLLINPYPEFALECLLREFIDPKDTFHLFLDKRAMGKIDKKIIENQKVSFISSGFWQRLKAEARLFKATNKATQVICFSNIPPFFPLRGRVFVYFQNLLLLKPKVWTYFKRSQRIKFYILRTLLYTFRTHGDEYWVQTHFTRDCLSHFLGQSHPVKVMPFYRKLANKDDDKKVQQCQYDFIYPAADAPHKNHGNLIRAWCLLAKQGYFPHLCLTIEKDSALWRWIAAKVQAYQLKITTLGTVDHSMMIHYYEQSRALIYPSFVESYGLPLLESQDLKLPIVAAETDYVYEVVTPNKIFDPHSPTSIAHAVVEFMSATKFSANECMTTFLHDGNGRTESIKNDE